MSAVLLRSPRGPVTALKISDASLTPDVVGRLPRVPAGHRLHLDLGDVRLPTAGGLGQLVRLHTELRDGGGRLVLWNVPAPTYEVFAATRLTELLDVRPA